MPMAAMARTGDVNTSAMVAQQTSKRRFTMLQRPTNGHEGFRGLEALLVAPGERPVAQRVERARMRIGTELAGVTRHRSELHLERGGDVHPRVRGERPRIGPLGTAGGVEGVDGADPACSRPR